MQSALDILSILGNHKEVTIRAKGNSIPNAVAVANIITENMLKGNSKIHKITVDSEPIQELGRAISNIEIILKKN
jgi:DNA-binding protein